jgi:hypothetical protein
MISVVVLFICLLIYSFIQHFAEYNRATLPVLIKVSMTLSLVTLIIHFSASHRQKNIVLCQLFFMLAMSDMNA